MALTPANVKSTLVKAIALAAPAAPSFSGAGIGIRQPTEVNFTPVVVQMNSENEFQDAFKVEIPVNGLQNGAATLEIMRAFANSGVQVYLKNAADQWAGFIGADFDSETLLGLDYEWSFKLNSDSVIKTTLMGEVSASTLDGLIVEADPAGIAWTSGESAAARLRPGVKNVTIGGANIGLLTTCDGFIKNVFQTVSLNRPVSIGVNYGLNINGAQMDNDEYEAMIALLNATGTVIVNFWNGESFKITNLFGGKSYGIKWAKDGTWTLKVGGFAPDNSNNIKFNTVSGVNEIVHQDNVSEA